MVKALPFYVLLVDERHYILFANKAVKEQLPVNLGKILGRYCPKVIHGLNKPFPGCPLEEAVNSGQSLEKVFFDSKSGRWLNSAVYPTRRLTAAGRKIFVHFVQDITDCPPVEQLKQKAIAEERNRIAVELHDDCAQGLAYMVKSLELCEKLYQQDYNKGLAEIVALKGNTARILASLRQVIYDLKTAGAEGLTLMDRLKTHLQEYEVINSIKIKTRLIKALNHFPPEPAKIIFNIVREALANIKKHSGVRTAELMTRQKGPKVFIKIKDQGRGFNPDRTRSLFAGRATWGLLNMQQGASALSGKLLVRSQVGRGTTILLTVPLLNKAGKGTHG
ncbi:MAG: hypothetical protein HY920_00785 [Elusimicrobia bacterium]|nr:hypothetical protein [Elusimicrobiota bacterium]